MAIRPLSWLPFARNQSNGREDHHDASVSNTDVPGPDNALPDVFDVLSGTNEHNSIEVDPDLPEISAATNAGTEERGNGTAAAIPDGPEFQPPPSIEVAQEALDAIKKLLKPPRDTGGGFKASGLDDLLRERLLEMKQFLWVYTDPKSQSHGKWIMSSTVTAKSLEKKPWHARVIRGRVRAFIKDHDDLPYSNYGTWNETVLEKDKAFAQEVHAHLQSVGKYVRAMDLVDFLDTEEMRAKTGHKKRIDVTTAQRWMKKLNYRWTLDPKGQYVDGHEREDIVAYRQHVFLPAWKRAQSRSRDLLQENAMDQPPPEPQERWVVVWYHDKSTFYANDRCKLGWKHKDATAVPYAKGEGPSQMVADMVSAEYGWLRSSDGKEEARILFKAGKNREGYFTNDEIIDQANHTMDLLDKHFPHESHVLVFDNATTHTKRPEGALSARCMPKNTSKAEKNWGVEVNQRDENGKPMYGSHGKILKTKIPMTNGQLPDGSPQSFYFESGPQAGLFKGMTIILKERGLIQESTLRAECKKFNCPINPAVSCCQRRVLYNQPDFREVKSRLEIICEARDMRSYSSQSSTANSTSLSSAGAMPKEFTGTTLPPRKRQILRLMCFRRWSLSLSKACAGTLFI
jgi:hypothetical protein